MSISGKRKLVMLISSLWRDRLSHLRQVCDDSFFQFGKNRRKENLLPTYL